ncbi:MAG: ribonuclease HII [Chloroflexota bacterium]|nr:ribonuclease HII [Chloroflexota bacterium]
MACRKPTFEHESEIATRGFRFIAGIDEVGRGALAGPVAAASVILPIDIEHRSIDWIGTVRDSKQLSPKRREALFNLIQMSAIAIGVGMVDPVDIDAKGIVEATRCAMCMAVDQLVQSPDFLLIDAIAIPSITIPQRNIIKGDEQCLSIACASIVAKVTRDRYMMEMDRSYPGYALANNKGYGTKQHMMGLEILGTSCIHRRTFVPDRMIS